MGVFGIDKQVINKKYHHNYTIGRIDRQKGIHNLRTKIPWTNSCAKKCKTVLFCSIVRLCILKSQSQAALIQGVDEIIASLFLRRVM